MPEAWRPEPARHIWLIGACILALAASVWAGSARVPASLTYALEDSDFLDRDVPILRTFIQMASAIQGRDAPLEAVRRFVDSRSSAGAVKADRSSEEAEMALHAHRLVLEESGGEWVSEVQAARIREILDRLARVTGERADWYSVTILDSLRVNAVSTADGRIYITRGLVTTSGDDEIAMVLAHEMHHIRSGHWMNWWVPSVGPALPPPEDGPAVQALVDAGVSQLAGEAVTSYAQEFEADARAVLHASWAGFEPTRMYRTLTRLPQMPVTSHPTVSDRIAGVRKVIGAMLDQAWIQSFHPVRVAQRAIVSEVEKGRAPEPSRSAQGFPGARAVAEACRQVLDKLDTLESRMRTAERRAPTRPENLPRGSGRIVGRPAFVSSSLAAVDVSVDTSLGKASSGSVGVTCGRVWLARVNGAWVPVVAQTAS
ncbi:MAG: M48 family metallopeptidase, partial [Firmicutes bacterium]|nr:M48 family metallopeptidase [Bacillota bacterium]